eukprot:gene15203-18580_t
MASASFPILAPYNPLVPIVVLSAPLTIAPCDDIVLDTTATFGAGRQPWLFVNWTAVSAYNNGIAPDVPESNITSYLTRAGQDLTGLIRVPNAYLVSNRIYSFTLTVQNFLGQIAA